MRTYKFRAWDKKQGKMIWWEKIKASYNFTAMLDYTWVNYEDYIVMQYIGIDDDNGKNIYVGDIVNIDGGRNCGGYTIIINSIIYDGYFLDHMTDEHILDVVGNIYEDLDIVDNIYENNLNCIKEMSYEI